MGDRLPFCKVGGSLMRYIIKGSKKVTVGLCYCNNCDDCGNQCGTQCMTYW